MFAQFLYICAYFLLAIPRQIIRDAISVFLLLLVWPPQHLPYCFMAKTWQPEKINKWAKIQEEVVHTALVTLIIICNCKIWGTSVKRGLEGSAKSN